MKRSVFGVNARVTVIHDGETFEINRGIVRGQGFERNLQAAGLIEITTLPGGEVQLNGESIKTLRDTKEKKVKSAVTVITQRKS